MSLGCEEARAGAEQAVQTVAGELAAESVPHAKNFGKLMIKYILIQVKFS